MGSCRGRREDEETERPGFCMYVDESVLHKGKLQIPRDFSWCDGVVPQQCHLETQSGSWQVDVKRIKKDTYLEKGWEEFVAGNSLKLGEYLVLQYVGLTKFFVEIYGRNHCDRSMASDISSESKNDVIIIDSDSDPEAEADRDLVCGRKVSWRGKLRNVASINPSGNHCFSIRICRSHTNRGPLLTPRSFLRNIPKPKKVKLQHGDESWDMKWSHPYLKSSRFSGGWINFMIQKEVKEGDICDFEMISKTDEIAVMKVTIRRGERNI